MFEGTACVAAKAQNACCTVAAGSCMLQTRVHHLTAPGQDRVLTVHFSELMFLERRECRYVYITLVRRNRNIKL